MPNELNQSQKDLIEIYVDNWREMLRGSSLTQILETFALSIIHLEDDNESK